jgi:hypothetical protein
MRQLKLTLRDTNQHHAAEVYELMRLAASDKNAPMLQATLGPNDNHLLAPDRPPDLLYEDGKKVPPPPKVIEVPEDAMLGRTHSPECYDQLDETGTCIC